MIGETKLLHSCVRSHYSRDRSARSDFHRRVQLVGPLFSRLPGLRFQLQPALDLEVERHCLPDEILQCRVVDLLAFIDINGAA